MWQRQRDERQALSSLLSPYGVKKCVAVDSATINDASYNALITSDTLQVRCELVLPQDKVYSQHICDSFSTKINASITERVPSGCRTRIFEKRPTMNYAANDDDDGPQISPPQEDPLGSPLSTDPPRACHPAAPPRRAGPARRAWLRAPCIID